jgi:magnesium transporter
MHASLREGGPGLLERGALSAAHEDSAAGSEPKVLLFDGDQVKEVESLDLRPERLRKSMLLWVDLNGASRSHARSVAAAFGLDQGSEARLEADDGAPYFCDGGHFIHVSSYTPVGDSGDELTAIECVVGERWVVTAHGRPAEVLDRFAELATGSGRTGELDGASFLAALLEWVLNEYAIAFERIEEELEEFDARAMRGESDPDDEIDYLVGLRIRLGRLRRALVAHRDPLLALAHPELEALGDAKAAEKFERLLERFQTTLQSARDARASIVSSFDVMIARTGHRTNEIVKVLTLASVIFLPGALVAGVLGMNFKVGIFEQPAYFWVAVALMVAIGVSTITVAKLRNWI